MLYPESSARFETFKLAAAVAGNMLFGSLFLGALLLSPLWLQSLLPSLQ